MSAKLLYSLSNNNSNLEKQIGCMNGFRQFFDRHHFITSRSANYSNRILPPDENTLQGEVPDGVRKKTKGKHPKVKKTQECSSESSRMSISSSSASTTMASLDYESYSSPCQSTVSLKFHNKNNAHELISICPSPITTVQTQQPVRHAKKHADSPRLSLPPKLERPRVIVRSDSFRSTTSNQSAPATPLRKKNLDEAVMDAPRFSSDGRETRNTCSLNLRDLPRLSLDSRQQTMKKNLLESKDDLALRHLRSKTAQNLPKEPASCRPPSNIVAKLMGLEAFPDWSPSTKIPKEQNDSSICGSSDFLSRSSRTIDESKVNRVLYSPRKNSKESKTPAAKKDKLLVKPKQSALKKQEEQRGSGQIASKDQEGNNEPRRHTLTVYGKIEEKMNDLDFKRSGKDLRALKQVLESIHREKTKLLSRKENCSDCEFQTRNNPTYISQQGLRESTSTKDAQSRDVNKGKVVRDFKKDAAFAIQDLPMKNLHKIRITEPANHTKDIAQKRSTKHTTTVTANRFHDPSYQPHCTTPNNSGDRTPRPKVGPKGQPINKVNVPSLTLGSKTKQHKPDTKLLRSQTEKIRRKSYILKDTEEHSKVMGTAWAMLNQEKSTNTSFIKDKSEQVPQYTVLTSSDQPSMQYVTWQPATSNKNSEGISGDTSPKALANYVVEQPSPVSVLDANFYGDESPSPVKTKPTAFRDSESDVTYMVAEWKDIDAVFFQNSLRSSSIYEKDVEVDNYSPTVQGLQTVTKLEYSPGSTSSVESQKEVYLEKEYVSEILAASGFLNDIRFNAVNIQVGQSQQAIDPSLFLVLEQTKGSKYLSEKRSTSKTETIKADAERHQQKLLFDTVNEILSQKLSSTGLGCRSRFLKPILVPPTGSQEILQEIFTEINRLQSNSLHQSSDDEDDFLATIIEKDLAHASGNWTDVSSVIPGLVLDLERLIFKDLIVELVNEDAPKRQVRKMTH